MFDDERIKKIASMASASKQEKQKSWTPTAIFERLDRAIIGNERYKKVLASCLSSYLSEAKQRNHLLVFGPSGTGKTYLLQQTLPDFGLPYVIIDSSSLVPAGYSGNTLQQSLTEFYKINAMAADRSIIVMDEFDKISEKANGGDIHKSHSLQSELLTCIEGKKEGSIDTRNSLWICLGAFAYTEEMKGAQPKIVKDDLLKYGFKNELLGRITRDTMTDIPTLEEIIRRIVGHQSTKSFLQELSLEGFTPVEWEDEAVVQLAQMAQDPRYGMRILPSLLGMIKDELIFDKSLEKGPTTITAALVLKIKSDNF